VGAHSEHFAFTLRRAAATDSALILAWRNERTAVANSISSSNVSTADHQAWFQKVIGSEHHLLLMVEMDPRGSGKKEKIGMCRFDFYRNHSAEVSINLNPDFRGKGFGSLILEEGVNAFRPLFPQVECLRAQIRVSNIASQRVFARAGFVRAATSGAVAQWTRKLA